MFNMVTEWRVEKYITMIRITAILKSDNLDIVARIMEPFLMNKMLELIDASIKYKGKLIGSFPIEMPKEAKAMYVHVCMIFETDELVENFKKEIPKVLEQG